MKVINEKNARADVVREQLENRVLSRLPSENDRKCWHVLPLDAGWEEGEFHGAPARVFSASIQAALDSHANVEIPFSREPLYLDRAIILNSGNALRVHPATRMVLIGESLVLRNRNIVEGHFGRVSPGPSSDADIWVSGGIWEGPDTQMHWYGARRDFYGCDSMFMLSNVVNARFENLTVRDTRRMALQIGNCERFIVRNITLVDVNRDGIHVEGPAAYGLITGIRGKSGDDHIALNAWDWDAYSLTFGEIRDIIISDIDCEAGHLWAELRMLAGAKRMPDGDIIECDVRGILVRDVRGIHTVKLYHQKDPRQSALARPSPNAGSMYDLFFENIDFSYYPTSEYHTPKNAALEIVENVYGLYLNDIRFDYPLKSPDFDDYSAIAVGPMCSPKAPDDEEAVCHVPDITIENASDSEGPLTSADKLILLRAGDAEGMTGFGVIDRVRLV